MDCRRAAAQINLVLAAAEFRDRDRLAAKIELRNARRVIVEGDAGKAGEGGQLVEVEGAGVVEGQDVSLPPPPVSWSPAFSVAAVA